MADDIVLTVRVRDLTRGDLARVRQQMRGMDGDVRRMAQGSNLASERAQRLNRELQGVSGRLGQLQRSGRMAGSEMQFMRRSMGLLGRDLRLAQRAGELSREEFDALSRQLDETRLGFDRLARDVERHNAVAQRAHREAQRRQQQAQAMGRIQVRAQREDEDRLRRRARQQMQAMRMDAQRTAAQMRDIQQLGRMQTQAMRMDEEMLLRRGRMQAQAQRMDAQRTARLLRQQQQALRQGVTRLAGLGGDDGGLALRFQGMNGGDAQRMSRALSTLSSIMGGLSGSSDHARRNLASLNNDLRTMSDTLSNAQRDGNLTRREFNALANGLRLVDGAARDLRRSGDLSSTSLREVRRETALLRAQLRGLSGEGNFLDRMNSRLIILGRRLDDAGRSGSRLRRAGTDMAGGFVSGLRGVLMLTAAMRRLGAVININKRWTMLLVAALLLLGPIAQALGALLVTALGGAFLALGAFALRGEKDVRSAFTRMKGTIGSTVRQAAQPMREDLVAAMDQVGAAAQRMRSPLTVAFRAMGPLLDDLVGAFTDFAQAALPGFTQALSSSGPAMAGFREAMTLIGDGLGEMFAIMTRGDAGEALQQVWIDLGTELRNLLVSLGEFISTASQSGTATMIMAGLFRTLTGILNLVAGALEALDPLFDIVAAGFRKLADVSVDLDSMPKAFDSTGKSVKQLHKELTATDKEIKKIQENQDWADDWLDGPAVDQYLKDAKSTEEDLAAAQMRRKDLLGAIAEAEGAAAAETAKHSESVSRLIDNLQHLADLNRGYLDAQASQFEALNKAKEGMTQYKDALKFTNGQIDLTSTAAQEAYRLLSDMGRATSETTDKAAAAGVPWEKVRKNWKESFNEIVRLGDGMGLTAEEARILAEQVLGIPPTRDVYIQARVAQAKADIEGVISAFEAAPDSTTVTVEALTADAEAALERMGFTITRLPDGKTQVTTATASAHQAISILKAALANLDGTTVDTFTNHHINTYRNYFSGVGQPGSKVPVARRPDLAQGGPVRGYADGGMLQHFPDGGYVQGPGGPMSDSILATFGSGAMAAVSDTEYVVKSQAVRKYGVKMLDRLNEGKLPVTRLAKGGPTKAQKEARKDLLSSFGISHFGTMAGYKRDPFEKSMGAPESLSSLVSSLNQLRNQIKKIFSGGKESSLLKQLDKWGKSLIKWQKQLRDVEKNLEKARDKLKALKDEAKQLSESVKSGVLSSSNITKSAQKDGPLTVASVMGDLVASRDKATAFASALKQLQKKGLRGDLIQQIAEAGIEGGGLETAGALLNASSSEISSINQLQHQIAGAAGTAGKVTADAKFGAAIKLQTQTVNKLEKSQRSLQKSMENLAKVMEKALKKALGGKAAGGPVGASSGGARGAWTLVGEHEPELVRLPYGSRVYSGPDTRRLQQQAWSSMLNRPRPEASGRTAAAPVVVASEPMVIQLKLGERQLGEVVVDVARKEVRARGGIEAAFKPPRGR